MVYPQLQQRVVPRHDDVEVEEDAEEEDEVEARDADMLDLSVSKLFEFSNLPPTSSR